MGNFDSSQPSSPSPSNHPGSKRDRDEYAGFLNLQPLTPIRLSVVDGRVVIVFPEQHQKDDDWQALVQRLNQKLANPSTAWKEHAKVDLILGGRLLDGRQLQLISKILINSKLTLDCVHTSRRQTAMAGVSAGYSVQQTNPHQLVEQLRAQDADASIPYPVDAENNDATPLVIAKTVRSGSEVKHPGLIILLGDVNPGGAVIADGDILVWGRLRGVAHAGASGDRAACIMALKMEPTQLRIADKVARAPANQLQEFFPEVAHIAADSIRITRAYDFSRLK
ncbi:MAG: septum site-determining protein MinC [Cyanobacteria bacterium P01_F01_bin.42]